MWQTRRRKRSPAGVSWLGGISFPRRLPANATLPPYRGRRRRRCRHRRRRRRRRPFVFLRSPLPVPVPASPLPPFPPLFLDPPTRLSSTTPPPPAPPLPATRRSSSAFSPTFPFHFRSFPAPSTSGTQPSLVSFQPPLPRRPRPSPLLPASSGEITTPISVLGILPASRRYPGRPSSGSFRQECLGICSD